MSLLFHPTYIIIKKNNIKCKTLLLRELTAAEVTEIRTVQDCRLKFNISQGCVIVCCGVGGALFFSGITTNSPCSSKYSLLPILIQATLIHLSGSHTENRKLGGSLAEKKDFSGRGRGSGRD